VFYFLAHVFINLWSSMEGYYCIWQSVVWSLLCTVSAVFLGDSKEGQINLRAKTMDPALLRERELFKRRALATPT
jgi:hypothetical protein